MLSYQLHGTYYDQAPVFIMCYIANSSEQYYDPAPVFIMFYIANSTEQYYDPALLFTILRYRRSYPNCTGLVIGSLVISEAQSCAYNYKHVMLTDKIIITLI